MITPADFARRCTEAGVTLPPEMDMTELADINGDYVQVLRMDDCIGFSCVDATGNLTSAVLNVEGAKQVVAALQRFVDAAEIRSLKTTPPESPHADPEP